MTKCNICDRCEKQTSYAHDVYLSKGYFDDDDEMERVGGHESLFGDKYEFQLCNKCFSGLRKRIKSFLKEGE